MKQTQLKNREVTAPLIGDRCIFAIQSHYIVRFIRSLSPINVIDLNGFANFKKLNIISGTPKFAFANTLFQWGNILRATLPCYVKSCPIIMMANAL